MMWSSFSEHSPAARQSRGYWVAEHRWRKQAPRRQTSRTRSSICVRTFPGFSVSRVAVELRKKQDYDDASTGEPSLDRFLLRTEIGAFGRPIRKRPDRSTPAGPPGSEPRLRRM